MLTYFTYHEVFGNQLFSLLWHYSALRPRRHCDITLVFVWIGRYSQTPWLSVFLFLTLQYFALSMNFLRQAMAATIVLWAYPFLASRRLLPGCGIMLLAACFHRTALIMLPLCLLLMRPPSKRHYGLAVLAAGAAYLLVDPLIDAAVSVLPKY